MNGYRQRRRRRQGGFGLVELMIAMVLGLLLVSAAVQVFLGTSASHRYIQALAEVQDGARFAMHVLGHDLRLAGFSGCPRPLAGRAPSAAAGSPYGNARVIARTALDVGIDGDNLLDDALALPDDELPGSADPDSDAVRLAYMRDYGVRVAGPANGPTANLKVGDNPNGWDEGDELLVTDCRRADLFAATDVSRTGGTVTIAHASDRNTDNKLSKVYEEGTRVLDPYAAVYYVRDGGGLYRREHFAETVATDSITELVPGVTVLVVRYGVDVDGDRVPDVYRTAAEVENDDQWAGVVTVRLGFVVASTIRIGNDAAGETLDVLGRQVEPPDDGRLRRVFTNTVTLRNRVP